MSKEEKRKWPCKSYTKAELDKFGSGFKLYLSDPDRVDFGEMLFLKTAQMIPFWIKPNTLTRFGITFNTLICLLSFIIEPAVNGELDWIFGSNSSAVVPMIVCLIMAAFQILVSALDNWDGLHARGTDQCSDLGALLDHYFDSSSIPMNSVAMALLFNSARWTCMIGVTAGPSIFHLQLLLNYYLKQEPRVMGPEAQMACMWLDIVTAGLFYYKYYFIIEILSYFAGVGAVFFLVKYIHSFGPRIMGHSEVVTQFAIFFTQYVVCSAAYFFHYMSTFELMCCAIWISWTCSGQIVTHDVLKENLPTFRPYYLLIPIGCILEYYYFNPLMWMVDSKNNIHLSSLFGLAAMAMVNVTHFRGSIAKVLRRSEQKKKTKKKKKKKNGM